MHICSKFNVFTVLKFKEDISNKTIFKNNIDDKNRIIIYESVDKFLKMTDKSIKDDLTRDNIQNQDEKNFMTRKRSNSMTEFRGKKSLDEDKEEQKRKDFIDRNGQILGDNDDKKNIMTRERSLSVTKFRKGIPLDGIKENQERENSTDMNKQIFGDNNKNKKVIRKNERENNSHAKLFMDFNDQDLDNKLKELEKDNQNQLVNLFDICNFLNLYNIEFHIGHFPSIETIVFLFVQYNLVPLVQILCRKDLEASLLIKSLLRHISLDQ